MNQPLECIHGAGIKITIRRGVDWPKKRNWCKETYPTTSNTLGLSNYPFLGDIDIYIPWERVLLEVRRSRGSKMRSKCGLRRRGNETHLF